MQEAVGEINLQLSNEIETIVRQKADLEKETAERKRVQSLLQQRELELQVAKEMADDASRATKPAPL